MFYVKCLIVWGGVKTALNTVLCIISIWNSNKDWQLSTAWWDHPNVGRNIMGCFSPFQDEHYHAKPV